MFLKVSQVDVRYAGQTKSAVEGVSLQLEAGRKEATEPEKGAGGMRERGR